MTENDTHLHSKKIVPELDFHTSERAPRSRIQRVVHAIIQTHKYPSIPMAYRFMLMTLSIIQHSLPLNHACKSQNMPVAPHTYINLCVCPGGS